MTDVRVCKLEDCDNLLPGDSSVRREYCCVSHGSLARLRRKRLKEKLKPFVLTGVICPVDGKVFPSNFYRKRGRPKKYDCESCAEVDKQLRLMHKELRDV